YIKHNPRSRRDGLINRPPVEICYISNLRSLRHIGSTLHPGIENAGLSALDGIDLSNPDRVLCNSRRSREHFEITHYVQGTVHEQLHIFRFYRAGVACLNGDGWLPAGVRRVIEITRGVRIFRPVAPDNDVVEAKRKHHVTGNRITFSVARLGPVRIGPKALIEITAVIVNEIVTVLHYLFGDLP